MADATLAGEVHELRLGAGVLARPSVSTLRLTGPDRARFLEGMVSNAVGALAPGQGTLAVKTSNRGRVEALVRVRAEEEALLIDVDRSVAGRLRETLDRFIIMDDCAIADVSGERQVASIFGARSAEVLGRAGLDPGPLADHAWARRGEVTVIRDATLLLPGFELHTPGTSEALVDRLVRAGATPISEHALDVARIEAGAPVDGRDLDEDTIPMEARLERAISLEKGCYVGQEVLARATNLGGVKHLLVGLVVEGDVVPEEGAPLFAGEARVGEVTSVARSPSLGAIIALGYVRRTEEAAGTRLTLRLERGLSLEATVTGLPFVAPR